MTARDFGGGRRMKSLLLVFVFLPYSSPRHGITGREDWYFSGNWAVRSMARTRDTNINTTGKHYIVPSVESSRRIARQRVAHRQAKAKTP